jgi:hypothetical protein
MLPSATVATGSSQTRPECRRGYDFRRKCQIFHDQPWFRLMRAVIDRSYRD